MSLDGELLINEIKSRGLIQQLTAEVNAFEDMLSNKMCVIYCGFDPTADSLHLGHLVPLLVLRYFQQAGHKPIALVGGATGLIGDPSFKANERQLHSESVIADWSEKIKKNVSQFLDFDCGENSAIVVNNIDWMESIKVIPFLRDIGKHFSVRNMINKDSVKKRIDREGDGISFTEFSYALLQAYDFSELNKNHDCTIQLGGSDQWGNIVAGIDLTRRLHGNDVYGLTVPLVTKADGTKFGKTESSAIWLDAKKTSPYAFYQFWIRVDDKDVYKFLRYFSNMTLNDIEDLENQDLQNEGRKNAQKVLAEYMTELVHNKSGLQSASNISKILFSGDIKNLTEEELQQLRQDGIPSSTFANSNFNGKTITQILVERNIANSGKQVKDALLRGAVFINEEKITMDDNTEPEKCFSEKNSLYGRFFFIRMGKKNYYLLEKTNEK